jgi:hypothetical protein
MPALGADALSDSDLEMVVRYLANDYLVPEPEPAPTESRASAGP